VRTPHRTGPFATAEAVGFAVKSRCIARATPYKSNERTGERKRERERERRRSLRREDGAALAFDFAAHGGISPRLCSLPLVLAFSRSRENPGGKGWKGGEEGNRRLTADRARPIMSISNITKCTQPRVFVTRTTPRPPLAPSRRPIKSPPPHPSVPSIYPITSSSLLLAKTVLSLDVIAYSVRDAGSPGSVSLSYNFQFPRELARAACTCVLRAACPLFGPLRSASP